MALDELLAATDGAWPNGADVQAARSLADAVDADPGNSPLWARYLEALKVVRDAVGAGDEAAEIAGLLAELSGGPASPV